MQQQFKDKSALIVKAQLPPVVQLSSAANKATPVVYNPKQCPCCKQETMESLMRFNRRGPPADWKEQAADMLACMPGNKKKLHNIMATQAYACTIKKNINTRHIKKTTTEARL